ncbi:MAG: alpha/beta hydrolase [Actinomycetota bacterium]|nr:alpha/beta hydrolase [Actinomycetota bacterium]
MPASREPRRDLGFIHVFEPGSADRTLLLLHGTGGNERDLIPLGRELDPSASLLSPRGKVLENGMPRFFRRLAMGVFDVEDLVARTHELAGFVSSGSQAYGLDPERIVGVGYSNGANIAASLLLLHPGVLQGAVLLHAMVPFRPETLPDLSGTAVLLTAGRLDPMVSTEQSEELANLLSDAGAEVSFHWEQGGHELGALEVSTARTWLAAFGDRG